MKVVICSKYEYLVDFIKNIPSTFEQEGTTIYEGRNTIKVFHVRGLTLNVKRFKKPIYVNRLIYTFIRLPKAVRSYNYAFKLLAKGIETPTPIAYILCFEKGLLSWSYFVSIQISDSYQTLYKVGQGSVKENEDIFRELGIYTALLHQKGIYHKDYSPGNILYCRKSGYVHFILIDINRMSFGPVSLKKGCANFARIWGKKAAFEILAENYAKALHVDKSICIKLILYYRQRFWKRYAKKHPIMFDM